MALIHCRECGKEYSTQAAACPSCACPTAVPATEPVIVVEATAKHWKKLKLIGILMMLGSCVPLVGMQDAKTTKETMMAGMIYGLLLFDGIGTIIYAKAKAWWYHG